MSKTEIRNVIAYFSVVASFVQIRCSLFAVARLLLFILLSLLASLLAAVAYNTIVLSLIFSICSGHSDDDDDYDNADGRIAVEAGRARRRHSHCQHLHLRFTFPSCCRVFSFLLLFFAAKWVKAATQFAALAGK